jgi:septum formation inhibitor MinC
MVTNEEAQLTKKIHLATMRQQLSDIEGDLEEKRQKRTMTQHQTTVLQIEHAKILCKQCVMGMPESQKLWMEEASRNYSISVFNALMSLSGGGGQLGIENGQITLGGPVYTDDMQAVTISVHIIIPKGLKDPGNKMAMGISTVAVEMYADWNEGQKPLKERILINGYPVDVNKYFKKDLPLLEAAFVEWERRSGMAASQKLEKAQKQKEKEEAKESREAAKKESKTRKATEKALRDVEKKEKERVKEDKQERRRKSDLSNNQPSISKYF